MGLIGPTTGYRVLALSNVTANNSIILKRGWRGWRGSRIAIVHTCPTSRRYSSSLRLTSPPSSFSRPLDHSPPLAPLPPANLSSRSSLQLQTSSWPHSPPLPSPPLAQRGAIAFLSPSSSRHFSTSPRASCSAIIPSSIMADREILPTTVTPSHYDLSITALDFKDWTYQGNVT